MTTLDACLAAVVGEAVAPLAAELRAVRAELTALRKAAARGTIRATRIGWRLRFRLGDLLAPKGARR